MPSCGMPTRASKPRRPREANRVVGYILQESTGQAPRRMEVPDTRNPAAVALSKLGASKGGQARAAKLTTAKRRAIAKPAAAARWGKKP